MVRLRRLLLKTKRIGDADADPLFQQPGLRQDAFGLELAPLSRRGDHLVGAHVAAPARACICNSRPRPSRPWMMAMNCLRMTSIKAMACARWGAGSQRMMAARVDFETF